MDALEKLIAVVEQNSLDESTEKKVDPLAGLSSKEIRRRFDENGNPREGFNIDGSPISDKDGDSELSPKVKAIRDRASKRRARWERT